METIRELLQSISGYLRDRIGNPIYGAFAIAWGVINFRLVLVLFDDSGAQAKISYIDTRLYPEAWHWAWFGFLYPAAVALFFVLLSPFIYRWVVIFLRERNKVTQTRLLKQADETPLSNEAAARLRKSYLDERHRGREEARIAAERIDELTAQVDLLSLENHSLKERNLEIGGNIGAEAEGKETLEQPSDLNTDKEANNKIKNKKDVFKLLASDFINIPEGQVRRLTSRELTRYQAEVLFFLRNGTRAGVDSIASELGEVEIFEVRVVLDQLSELGLVSPEEDGRWYEITSRGRQALAAIMARGFESDAIPF